MRCGGLSRLGNGDTPAPPPLTSKISRLLTLFLCFVTCCRENAKLRIMHFKRYSRALDTAQPYFMFNGTRLGQPD